MECLDDAAVKRFVRGEMSEAESSLVAGHLKTCANCPNRVDMLVRAAEDSTQPIRKSPPPDAKARSEKPAPLPARDTGDVQLTREAPAEENVVASDDDAKPDLLDRGETIGRYLILDRLGQGGMGVVYAAYDPELDRKLAIKVLRRDSSMPQARLLREAQAMAKVSHPNVVAVHDVGTLGDRVFVAMEFADGGTLKDWVKKNRADWHGILEKFIEAGRGLAAAHASGLVHLDFKPENVLLDKDGRCRVTDFGLARLAGHAIERAADVRELVGLDNNALSTNLTQEGVVMGTPAYMAPEQHVGRASDARSDQFSFCAALYWALYQQWPFDPQAIRGAAASTHLAAAESTKADRRGARTGKTPSQSLSVINEPPKDSRVPQWLRRAIFRGLALAPGDRFATMDDLIVVLRSAPRSRRRRWYAAAAVVAIAATTGAIYQQLHRQTLLCKGADRKLAGVWDSDVQTQVQNAVLAHGKAHAEVAWTRIKDVLDKYSGEWVAMHTDACEATRLRGEQSEQILSLRMICLDRRLDALRALTGVLADADDKTVEKASDAVHSLPPLRQCSDVESLTARVPLPEDRPARQKIEEGYRQLANARALGDAGRYKKGLEIAQKLLPLAQATHYRPLEAEVLGQLGRLEMRAGDGKSGEKTLVAAVMAADASRNDQTRIEASNDLIYDIGYLLGRVDDALRWSSQSSAAIERIGGNDDAEVSRLMNEGAVYVLYSKFPQARDRYERALALAEKALPKDHPARAKIQSNLGFVYLRQREFDRAEHALQAALAQIERTQGPEHSNAGYAHYTLSQLYEAQKKLTPAMEHVNRALAVFQEIGAEQMVGYSNDALATILSELGRHSEALERYQRALAIKQKTLGDKNPDLAYSYDGIGQCYLALHKPKLAIPFFEKALSLRPEGADGLSDTRFGLAKALWESHLERERAHSLALQARQGYLSDGHADEARAVEKWLAFAGRPR